MVRHPLEEYLNLMKTLSRTDLQPLKKKTNGFLKWSDSSGIRQVVISNTSEKELANLKTEQIIMAYGDL